MRLVSCLFVACCVLTLFLPFTCHFLTLFSLLSLLSFIISSSSLLPSHVLFWPFFSHFFSALRSAHVFPSVLIYTEDLGKYAPRYLFFSLVELFQTKYVPLETSHGAALADGHRQTTETSSVVLAIKVLRSYDGQIKTLQTESVHRDSGEAGEAGEAGVHRQLHTCNFICKVLLFVNLIRKPGCCLKKSDCSCTFVSFLAKTIVTLKTQSLRNIYIKVKLSPKCN